MKNILTFIVIFLSISLLKAQTGEIKLKNGKYGIVSQNGKKVLADYIFNEIVLKSERNLYIVKKDSLFGILDLKGNQILQCEYTQIIAPDSLPGSLFLITKDGCSFYDYTKKEFSTARFSVSRFNDFEDLEEWAKSFKTGQSIIIDRNGIGILQIPDKPITETIYTNCYPCSYFPGKIVLQNQKDYQFFDLQRGKFISPVFETLECDYPLIIDGNVCYINTGDDVILKVQNKFGIYSLKTEKFTVEPEYDRIIKYNGDPVHKPFKILRKASQCSILTENQSPMKFKADEIIGFSNNKGVVKIGEKYCFVDSAAHISDSVEINAEQSPFQVYHDNNCMYCLISNTGKLLFNFEYQWINIYNFGFTLEKNNKFAFADISGKIKTPFKYDAIDYQITDNGHNICVTENEKQGLMTSEGIEITKPEYDFIFNIDGYKPAEKDGKYGYLDPTGKLVIPCIYEDAAGFGIENLAYVKLNGKYGFINPKGEIVIPCIYDKLDYFRNGKARAELNGQILFIDSKGNRQ